MSKKVWLVLSVLLNLIGGLQNGLVPAMSAKSLGITMDGAGLEVLRFVGALQFGFALLSWLGMRATSAEGQRTVDLTLFTVYLLGVPYAVRQLLITEVGVGFMVQGAVAAVFAVVFGYYAFSRRTQEAQKVGSSSRAAGQ